MSRNKFIFCCLVILAAYCAGRFTGPKHVETKEVEKIVYKDRVKKDETTETHVETRETVLPDGTRIKETIRGRKKETHTEAERQAQTEKSKEYKANNQSTWSIGLYTDRSFIAGTVDRRIIGGLFFGVYGRSFIKEPKPEVGLGLRFEF
jgi:hypothetical protein